MNIEDCTPFPIQSECKVVKGKLVTLSESTIPEWLAKVAYQEYRRGHQQDFSCIAKRGGFGRAELIALIRGEYTAQGIRKADQDLNSTLMSDRQEEQT